MARAAIRLKCSREVVSKGGDFTSFNQASFTSAVGFRVELESFLLTVDARRRSSSYVTLNR